MRRIKYEVGHAISGYTSDQPPAYYTNLKHARAAAVAEVRDYLEAEEAYDDNGKRYPVGHDNHITVTKEGPYKWRLTRPMGWSRYVYVADVDDDLFFDADGEVWQRTTTRHLNLLATDPAVPTVGVTVTWEHVSQDW